MVIKLKISDMIYAKLFSNIFKYFHDQTDFFTRYWVLLLINFFRNNLQHATEI